MSGLTKFIVVGLVLAMGCQRNMSGEKQYQSKRPKRMVLDNSFPTASRQPPSIAVGRGRIGQLYQGKLRVWRSDNWDAPELEFGTQLCAVTALPDGSLATVGGGTACVLSPTAKSPTCDKFLDLMAIEGRARIWGARDGALVVLDGSLVKRFRLTPKEALLDSLFKLPGTPELAVPLGEAAVVWTDWHSLRISLPSSERPEWRPESGSVRALASASDGVWVALSDNRLVLIRGTSVVRALSIPQRVISIAADEKHVLVLTSDERTQRFCALLLEPSGKEVWRFDFAWPKKPVSEIEPYAALSPFEPIAVVGSTSTLHIWDRATGKLVAAVE